MENAVLNEILTKYRENKLAHAYLIESNNLDKVLLDLKNLIKNLNCPKKYQEACTNCNLCNLINLNNLPSLKIITPDGAFIKKNQIEELKKNFATIPIYSKYNIYIIQNAEKLNPSSANSMLKFIEEPNPGILGFFLTSNKDIIMDTIKSRCELYTINYEENNLKEKLNIDDETYNSYLNLIKEYLPLVDSNKIINHKNIILNKFSDRKDIENIFKIILELYYQTFLKLNNQEYNSDIINISKIPENMTLINKKMQIITNILINMSYNVSIELILDKFVIEMRGCHG